MKYRPPAKSSLLHQGTLRWILSLLVVIALVSGFVLYYGISPHRVQEAKLRNLDLDFSYLNSLLVQRLSLVDEYWVRAQGPLNPQANQRMPRAYSTPSQDFLLANLPAQGLSSFNRGVNLLKTGNVTKRDNNQEALGIFQSLYDQYRDNWAVAFNFAFCLWLNRAPDQALQVMEPILAAGGFEPQPRYLPFFALARFNQGVYYLMTKDYDQAKRHFRLSIRCFRRMAEAGKFGPRYDDPYYYCRLYAMGLNVTSLYPVIDLVKTYMLMGEIHDTFKPSRKKITKHNRVDKLFIEIREQYTKHPSGPYKLIDVWASDNYRVVYATFDYRQDPLLLLNLGVFSMRLDKLKDAIFFFEKAQENLDRSEFPGLDSVVRDNLALAYLRAGHSAKANQLLARIDATQGPAGPNAGISLSWIAPDLAQLNNIAQLRWQATYDHYEKRLKQEMPKQNRAFVMQLRDKSFAQGLKALNERGEAMAASGDVTTLARLRNHMEAQSLDSRLKSKISVIMSASQTNLPLTGWLRLLVSKPQVKTSAQVALPFSLLLALFYWIWFVRSHLKYRRLLLESDFIDSCANKNIDLEKLTRHARRTAWDRQAPAPD